jgi:hypothetical protein
MKIEKTFDEKVASLFEAEMRLKKCEKDFVWSLVLIPLAVIAVCILVFCASGCQGTEEDYQSREGTVYVKPPPGEEIDTEADYTEPGVSGPTSEPGTVFLMPELDKDIYIGVLDGYGEAILEVTVDPFDPPMMQAFVLMSLPDVQEWRQADIVLSGSPSRVIVRKEDAATEQFVLAVLND